MRTVYSEAYGGVEGFFTAIIPPQFFNDAEELMQLLADTEAVDEGFSGGFAFNAPHDVGGWDFRVFHSVSSEAEERALYLYKILLDQNKISLILRWYRDDTYDEYDSHDAPWWTDDMIEDKASNELRIKLAESLPSLVLEQILRSRSE
jgi:hypothetical protein